jgi:hypothetical protein
VRGSWNFARCANGFENEPEQTEQQTMDVPTA